MAGPIQERNQDATVYVGNLDDKASEPLLWELFLQAGPVVNVHMPKDRITQAHQGYGFIEFMGEEDADYAIKIMNMIKVYGKPIRVNKASAHNKNLDVGANVFIGNLDPEIDEKLLYDTFSAFGVILQTPKIMRDPETGNSKGFAFINFASFAASDAAIEAMNGQYLSNRPISVSYAFKKDSKGERHGSAAERLLASQNPLSQTDRPHQLFADAPPIQQMMPNDMPRGIPLPLQGMPLPGIMHQYPGMPTSQQPFNPFTGTGSHFLPPQPGFMPDGSMSMPMPPGSGPRQATLSSPRTMMPGGHLAPPMPPVGLPHQDQPVDQSQSGSNTNGSFINSDGYSGSSNDMTGNFRPFNQFDTSSSGGFGPMHGPMGQRFGTMYGGSNLQNPDQFGMMQMPHDQSSVRPRQQQPPLPPPPRH
eukprot:gene7052-7844_t